MARLAEIETALPPILVHRLTMRVIDGMHRLLAARVKGQKTIEVEFFDGTPEDAFLYAVEANISHGLPLSLADRRAAATRIIASHPQLSDRAIARAAGLGAKTVAAIRRRCSGGVPHLSARIGRDGKVRPLNSVAGRRRAAELIAERPEASLREVARLAGISPATVSDVRKRLETGQPPVTERVKSPSPSESSEETAPTAKPRADRRPPIVSADPANVLEKLLRDPSLRHKEGGRQLLRLLRQNAIAAGEWDELMDAVPSHCGALVVGLARHYAEIWTDFAQLLDERVQIEGRKPDDE
ncbi:transcriptional regulator [Streptomyces arenae]|uniref:transcriptional regulator n=1 Tax=Streptomyces arenae TaxID=29301 RepID=UPI0026582CEF|nr:transcriptional regulator [Streptomyces arenae]MCG7202672.1 transcriptional regulator [Streptomyces arenae]